MYCRHFSGRPVVAVDDLKVRGYTHAERAGIAALGRGGRISSEAKKNAKTRIAITLETAACSITLVISACLQPMFRHDATQAAHGLFT